MGSGEGLEHGDAFSAQGLGLLDFEAAFYVDSVVGRLGRGAGQGCGVQVGSVVVL